MLTRAQAGVPVLLRLSVESTGFDTRRMEMRKFCVVALTLAIMAISGVAAGGQQQDFSKVEIKATKGAGNIYMLEGAGGNIAASIGADGVVNVDDQFAPLAEKIQAALKNLGITDKPERFVINTHYHGDHNVGEEAVRQ